MQMHLHRLREDPRLFRPLLAVAAVMTSFLVAWGVRPDTTTADDFASPTTPPDLGTLIGQELSLRVIPGPNGPAYEVLDESGISVGRFKNEFEMIAAFNVPAPSTQLADVPTYDAID